MHVSDDVTGFARSRDARVEAALERDGVALRRHPGLYVADLPRIATPRAARTRSSRRSCAPGARRSAGAPERAPRTIAMAPLAGGRAAIPARAGLRRRAHRACRTARRRAPPPRGAPPRRWLRSAALERYAERRDVLAEPTSRLSAYLRFGCLSPLWLERRVAARGLQRYRDQLAWRDFLAAVQLHFPETARVEFDARYRTLEWDRDPALVARLARGRAPASRSSTPRCASSRRPAGCTTARG